MTRTTLLDQLMTAVDMLASAGMQYADLCDSHDDSMRDTRDVADNATYAIACLVRRLIGDYLLIAHAETSDDLTHTIAQHDCDCDDPDTWPTDLHTALDDIVRIRPELAEPVESQCVPSADLWAVGRGVQWLRWVA